MIEPAEPRAHITPAPQAKPAAPGDATESSTRYEFDAELWEHDGDAAWHFVSLPEQIADAIADHHEGHTRAFGSVKVSVTVGVTRWSTSLFPDSKRGTYLLPMKRAVRAAEGLQAGDTAHVTLEVAAIAG